MTLSRRNILGVLGGAAAWPLAARSQEPGRTYLVDSLSPGPWDAPHHVAFRDELTRLSFMNGGNLAIDRMGHGMRPEQFAQHATVASVAEPLVTVAAKRTQRLHGVWD